MKRRFNKVLAVLVLIAIAFCAVPMVLASSDVELVYDLVGSDAKTAHLRKYSETNDTWESIAYPSSNFAMNSNSKSGLQLNIAVGAYWAIEVDVPQAGSYTLSMSKSDNPYGGKAKVYFGSSANGLENVLAGNEVGTVDFTNYQSSSNITSTQTLVDVGRIDAPQAGKYYMIFYTSEKGNLGSRQYFSKVILKGLAGDPIPDVDKEGIKIVYNMNTGYVEAGAWVDGVKFEHTNGFWAYEGANRIFSDSAYVRENPNGLGAEAMIGKNAWWAIRAYIPKSGEYVLKLNQIRYSNGGTANVHFGKASEGTAAILEKTPIGSACFYSDSQTSVPEETVGTISVDAPGEYILVFQSVTPGNGTNGTRYRQIFKEIILDGGKGMVPMLDISANTDVVFVGETATVTAVATLMSDGVTPANASVSYAVEEADASVASVTSEGSVKGLSEGTATIIATAIQGNVSSERVIEIEVNAPIQEEPGEKVSDTLVNFTFVASDKAAGSVSANGYPIVGEVEIGTSVSATANANDGYEFAYWRNGAGTVLSTEETATFKFNTNTAVYAEFIKIPNTDATAVPIYFYNGNGEFLNSRNVTKGTLFKDAKIANPSMTGYIFKHWSDKSEETEIAEDKVINSMLRAVAIYKDSGIRYTVKADGEVITSEATYGSEVTVTSNAEDFKAWKLGDKIVSYDKSYTFYVWDNVELLSSNEGKEAPVAVLENVDGNPLLIYSAPPDCEILEAGILFGNGATIVSYDSKAFAKEGTGQFTAQPEGSESDKSARGYLIFKKNGTIRVIYAD